MENTETQSQQFREGSVARTIERQTARIPSDIFLWGAIATMGVSLVGQVLRPRRMRLFERPSRAAHLSLWIGQWSHTLMLLGIYNKIVKIAGASDRQEVDDTAAVH